ncbi:succinate semialdehyde dehydrogenase [Novosphingobium sp. CF614]|uniref:NAD-dependent succinate-semialdehyde dehydrogenase n=1 Tax=Novosphingobium sp. CF614 TaxID=1884364 RepID=UPI0008EE76E7|nr:NAD-dependent succinate-semialdehyde dehydrogenase [Novosphingobium sp. CF614]SFG11419.1 succinate semialdehyde dehydrogenase [Novosphingobium sp. CF614]
MPQLRDPSLLREAALVAGAWLAADPGTGIAVDNPADGSLVGHVPACGRAETQAAIDAAMAAWPEWRARTAGERCALVERWHALVLENLPDLARIMTAEQGKPLPEAEGEIRYSASFIKWFAEEGRRVGARNVTSPERDRRIIVLAEPVGPSAIITPWNFPAAMITRKCAPALAAGCPVIIKPSEFTPFTALALADLALRAGIPPGLVHVVTGTPQEIGATFAASPDVRKLSFTGSTRVGALLMRQCADTIKRVSLELGGNAPLIVFEDADLDLAVKATMVSKFRNSGQTCVCANRILVHAAIHDEFAARLGTAVAALHAAPGMEAGSTIGPLINAAAVAKVSAHVADALDKGGRILAAGGGRKDGNFARAVVIADARTDMRLASEETFGPVAPLFRFEDEAQALAMANDTPYGLASYFYTRDLSRAFRVAEALEAGMVALNTGSIAMEMAPFGGIKQSGLGREGGTAGIEEYLETKAFHIGGLER